MGIPKFFRWLSERYPLVNTRLSESPLPEIDNFYLDMNGIIHRCSHPYDNALLNVMDDQKIFVHIFDYVDRLFHLVRPKRVFYLAVDGVAPRAKMNQQRSRRFRTADEARKARETALAQGIPLPEEEVFDSNQITPGTQFMGKLSEYLDFFIRKKIAEDDLWRGVEVILSGHEVPGEGEHKIVEWIRHRQQEPDWIPNQSHCIHGLDADLVMLGLVTHEPHFCLLREEVLTMKARAGVDLGQEEFWVLHLSVLREYLAEEFSMDLKGFESDPERIVDDFILMCVFVGNDFLPHLPALDIAEGSIDDLFRIYRELLPEMGGYLCDGAEIDMDRLDMFLVRLAEIEHNSTFSKRMGDALGPTDGDVSAAAFAGDLLFGDSTDGSGKDGGDGDGKRYEDTPASLELASLAKALEEDDDEMADELSAAAKRERFQVQWDARKRAAKARVMHKKSGAAASLDLAVPDPAEWRHFYYAQKVGIDADDEEMVLRVRDEYIRGLSWVMRYYHRGCASWSWFYPFHYAPLASDLYALYEVDLTLDPGKPFLPFQQLLGVLPPASSKFLPEAYRSLMTSPESPIADFYPTEIGYDANGKKNSWEAVVKIDFVDEKRLVSAAESISSSDVAVSDRKRNALRAYGRKFVYDADQQGEYPALFPEFFAKSIKPVLSRCTDVELPPLPANFRGFHMVEGTTLGREARPGFPSLKWLDYTVALTKVGVCVFDRPSKNESLACSIPAGARALVASSLAEAKEDAKAKQTKGGEDEEVDEEEAGREADAGRSAVPVGPAVTQALLRYIGQHVWVNWPYFREAVVTEVLTPTHRIDSDGNIHEHQPKERHLVAQGLTAGQRELQAKRGVLVPSVTALIGVKLFAGMVQDMDGTTRKVFVDPPRLEDEEVEAYVKSLNAKAGGGGRGGGGGGKGGRITLQPGQTLVGSVRGRAWSGAVELGTRELSRPYFIADACVPFTEFSDSRFDVRGKRPLSEAYAVGTPVVFAKESPQYGLSGVVTKVDEEAKTVQVKVSLMPSFEAEFTRQVVASSRARFFSYAAAARAVNVSVGVVMRIVGKCLVKMPRTEQEEASRGGWRDRAPMRDIGLGLKVNGDPQAQVTGYCERSEYGFQLSQHAIRAISEYREAFPGVFEYLEFASHKDLRSFDGEDLRDYVIAYDARQAEAHAAKEVAAGRPAPAVDPDAKPRDVLYEVEQFLRRLPCAKLPRVPVGTRAASVDAIATVEAQVDAKLKPALKKLKPKTMTVEVKKPRSALLVGVAEAHKLAAMGRGETTLNPGDRVVHVAADRRAPFGARGTVVSARRNTLEVVFDNHFMGGTSLMGQCQDLRGAVLDASTVIGVSLKQARKAKGKQAGNVVKVKQVQTSLPRSWETGNAAGSTSASAQSASVAPPAGPATKATKVPKATKATKAPKATKATKAERVSKASKAVKAVAQRQGQGQGQGQGQAAPTIARAPSAKAVPMPFPEGPAPGAMPAPAAASFAQPQAYPPSQPPPPGFGMVPPHPAAAFPPAAGQGQGQLTPQQVQAYQQYQMQQYLQAQHRHMMLMQQQQMMQQQQHMAAAGRGGGQPAFPAPPQPGHVHAPPSAHQPHPHAHAHPHPHPHPHPQHLHPRPHPHAHGQAHAHAHAGAQAPPVAAAPPTQQVPQAVAPPPQEAALPAPSLPGAAAPKAPGSPGARAGSKGAGRGQRVPYYMRKR